ncbi:MAG: hypothetical protein ACKO7W_14650 [Elainella sp.]
MNHYCYNWIEEWCQENGWTELFMPKRNDYWAFPPNGVMPLPIPVQVLRQIKADRGLSRDEQFWGWMAGAATLLSVGLCYMAHSPMPFVAAFAFCAVVVANMEVDD